MNGLSEAVQWITVARVAGEGRACRDYVVYDGGGTALLGARSYPWRREIVVHTATSARAEFLLRRRVSFPLTGRVDVYDRDRRRLGVVRRNGQYYDAAGRVAGRFRDARSFGDHAREAAFMGVLDAMFSGDGTTAAGSSPGKFVWLVDAQPVGTLGRASFPFAPEPARAAVHVGEQSTQPVAATPPWLSRLAHRLRDLVQPPAPRAWKLERLPSYAPDDPRLVVAAALFTIELSHW